MAAPQQPKISVLMPAYNAARYIGESIESILRQTCSDFELLIADDCSTDATWNIIQTYAKRDGRIVAVKNERNLGITANRNILIGLARADYFVWQDADDVSMPERLEHQHAYMEAHPAVGICGGWLDFIGGRGQGSVRKYKEDDESLRKTIFRFSPVAQPGAIVRKTAIARAGGYDPRYVSAEDLDMSFRIGETYRFANLQEVVIKYRENAAGATFTKLRIIELNSIRIRFKYARTQRYAMSIADCLYNILHYLSVYLVPTKFKIILFNAMRNST